jgi:hypothetical protein
MTALLVSSLLVACGDGEKAAGSATASASAAKPTATATAKPTATATATASAAPLEPRKDCPKDSAGPGTLDQPCLAKGTSRMMEVKWNNKMDDKGPFFSVTNVGPLVTLYGKLAVYFYDKDGKLLEVKDPSAPDKKLPYQTCSGKIFGGTMKPKENFTIQFSCVKKEHVPEGATAIEGELISVGFADSSGEKIEFYWSNPELAPADRKKGGVAKK